MTIQTVLDYMMLHDNALDLIVGGDEVTRGIRAVSFAQKQFESIAAAYADILETYQSVNTTADQEYTTWPTALMRLDSIWYAPSGVPQFKLDPIKESGGHAPNRRWPLLTLTSGGSVPAEYRASGPGSRILWAPTPDAVYAMRIYGLWAADAYTAAANTFAYPDAVALPISVFAAELMRRGLERDSSAIEALSRKTFTPVLKNLHKFDRTEPQSRVYSDEHET